MPVIIRAFELDFYGERALKPEWADRMTDPMDAELERVLTGLGGDTFDDDDLGDVAGASDVYHGFRRWSEIAMLEIAAQKTNRYDFHRYSVDQWRFRDGLEGWSSALDADFVLTVLFRDTHETTGRAVGLLLGGAYTYWKQIGVACIVDIKAASMVACSAKIDRWQDLREPANAKAAVYELLADVLGLPVVPRKATNDGLWAIPRAGRPQ